MQINEQDLARYRAFKKLFESSKIEVHGEALILSASLKVWFDGLEERFEEFLKPTPLKPKEKKQSMKKL